MRRHRNLLVAAILVPFCFKAADAGIILTVAGVGDTTDGISATNAVLSSPSRFALDSAGNIYVADRDNHRIRKVSAETGLINTVAGTGTNGYNGDGIPATNANLHSPEAAVLDSMGNLYIADSYNLRIRKVDAATGLISTVAGTGTYGYNGDDIAATNAALAYPLGIAVDAMGNLYIADSQSNRIRKVDAATGMISTVAGTETGGYNSDGIAAIDANLFLPSSLTIDGLANLYIADSGNNRIRRVDAVTGLISTVAGTGTGGYNGDTIAAIDANLYFPKSVAFDGFGNLYIADSNNNRVRRVNAVTGLIGTIAGTGTAGYNGDEIAAVTAQLSRPGGVVIDGSNNIYVSDSGNNRIRKVHAATGLIATMAGIGLIGYIGDGGLATNAFLDWPSGVAFDSSDNFCIADSSNQRIRKVYAATGIINTVAGTGMRGYNGDDIAAADAALNYPYGVAYDDMDNLYIADSYNHRIRKVDAVTGLISTVAGTGIEGYNGDDIAATSAKLSYPAGIAFDANNNLYIADWYNNRIRRLDSITGLISTVAGMGEGSYNGEDIPATEAYLDQPWGVVLDAQGNLYIADMDNNRIRRVDAATGLITTVAGTGDTDYNGDGIAAVNANLDWPCGVAVDKSGNIYIADEYNHRVRKVDAVTGLISTVAGTGIRGYNGDGIEAIGANLQEPWGVAIDKAGYIYIADTINNRIRKLIGSPSTVAPIHRGPISDRLKAGSILAAPNILRPSSGRNLVIHMSGDANATVEVEIYDEVGGFIGTLKAVLDGEGYGQAVIQGGRVNGKLLAPGAYWVLVKGGGVNDKKRFMVMM